MPTTGPDSRLYVVVGVVTNSKGQLLVQQRLPDKPCAGQWEFPGGKVESNESAIQALERELFEELGIRVKNPIPLIQLTHDYNHANVWLDVFMVEKFSGELINREGQNYAWKALDEIADLDILEAVPPILQAAQKFLEIKN